MPALRNVSKACRTAHAECHAPSARKRSARILFGAVPVAPVVPRQSPSQRLGVLDVRPLCLLAAASARAWKEIRACQAWARLAGRQAVEAGLELRVSEGPEKSLCRCRPQRSGEGKGASPRCRYCTLQNYYDKSLKVRVIVNIFSTLFIFRERGKKGEIDGEKHQSVAFHKPPTSDLAHSLGMCPLTEPHHPGLTAILAKC